MKYSCHHRQCPRKSVIHSDILNLSRLTNLSSAQSLITMFCSIDEWRRWAQWRAIGTTIVWSITPNSRPQLWWAPPQSPDGRTYRIGSLFPNTCYRSMSRLLFQPMELTNRASMDHLWPFSPLGIAWQVPPCPSFLGLSSKVESYSAFSCALLPSCYHFTRACWWWRLQGMM